jgi:hypothetical protein
MGEAISAEWGRSRLHKGQRVVAAGRGKVRDGRLAGRGGVGMVPGGKGGGKGTGKGKEEVGRLAGRQAGGRAGGRAVGRGRGAFPYFKNDSEVPR